MGKFKIEPQKFKTAPDLPSTLRRYRTSLREEEEIKKKGEQMLRSEIIKYNQSPYATPVTLAYKRDEGKKRF